MSEVSTTPLVGNVMSQGEEWINAMNDAQNTAGMLLKYFLWITAIKTQTFKF